MALNAGSSFVGDTGSGGKRGFVPAPAAGDAASGKFLKANGTWATPTGGGATPGSGNGNNTAATISGLEFFPVSTTTFGVRKGYAVDSTLTTVMTYATDSTIDITTSGASGVDLKALTGTIDTTNASYVVTGTGTAFLTEFGTRTLTGTAGTGGSPSTTVTGVNTRFTQECAINDLIGNPTAGYVQITSVDSDTQVTLSNNITLTNGSTVSVIEQPYLTVAGEPQLVNVILDDTNLYTSYNWTGTNTGVTGYAGRAYGAGSPTNSWLNVFAIAKFAGADPALMGSTQRTTPLNLPANYTVYRRIGSLQTKTNGNVNTVFTCKREGDSLNFQGAQENAYFVYAGSSLVTFQPANASAVAPPTAESASITVYVNSGGNKWVVLSDTGVDDTYLVEWAGGGEYGLTLDIRLTTQTVFYRTNNSGFTVFLVMNAYTDACSVISPPPATISGPIAAIDGLEPYYNDALTLGVRAGRCLDSTGATVIVLATDSLITLATNGLDGFDGPSLPAGPGCLDVWALIVSGTTRLLLAAQTGIVGSYGDTARRRLGAVMFGDDQKPILFTAERLGASLTIRMDDDGATHRTSTVLSAGTAGSMTSVSCVNTVPLRTTSALVCLTAQGANARGYFGATTSAAASSARTIYGTDITTIAEIPIVAQAFAYQRTSGSISVDVAGYREDCTQ